MRLTGCCCCCCCRLGYRPRTLRPPGVTSQRHMSAKAPHSPRRQRMAVDSHHLAPTVSALGHPQAPELLGPAAGCPLYWGYFALPLSGHAVSWLSDAWHRWFRYLLYCTAVCGVRMGLLGRPCQRALAMAGAAVTMTTSCLAPGTAQLGKENQTKLEPRSTSLATHAQRDATKRDHLRMFGRVVWGVHN
jgi:hypothetical protein